jgi:hypothetical protein
MRRYIHTDFENIGLLELTQILSAKYKDVNVGELTLTQAKELYERDKPLPLSPELKAAYGT